MLALLLFARLVSDEQFLAARIIHNHATGLGSSKRSAPDLFAIDEREGKPFSYNRPQPLQKAERKAR